MNEKYIKKNRTEIDKINKLPLSPYLQKILGQLAVLSILEKEENQKPKN